MLVSLLVLSLAFAPIYAVHYVVRFSEGLMPRTLRDAKLDTRNARARLKARREPYWRSISEGLAIGFRKGAKGGTWIARHYTPDHGRRFQALGTTDDVANADGEHVLSFAQAQAVARRWFAELARQERGTGDHGPYSIGQALDDYIADYKRRGGKALDRLQWTIRAHIEPELGEILVDKLTRRRIETWHARLADAPGRLRTAAGERQQHREADSSPEGVRRRRSTANRVLTILKAALNLAVHNHRADAPERWQMARPFRETDSPKIRYLSDAESQRLVNASAREFRALVTGALLTGCRYGELAAMRAGDYNSDAKVVLVPFSKNGWARHVHVTDEGAEFFARMSAGKEATALLIPRTDGRAWGQAHQFRPMLEACRAAGIKPAIGFHVLRHTYESRLAMKGVPMAVIAEQLGHSDTRMTERHYAHLAPSYVGNTVRAAFGRLGVVEPSTVVPLERAKA
jgi:integrase